MYKIKQKSHFLPTKNLTFQITLIINKSNNTPKRKPKNNSNSLILLLSIRVGKSFWNLTNEKKANTIILDTKKPRIFFSLIHI